jgi:prepilin-type N-terminal cleavage/methylation domain-containing protein
MSSPLTHGGRDACKAFTLIELLTVIAIIGVLAGLTFGVARGVSDKGRVGRAEAELAALATGMEEYRRYFGDYLHLRAAENATEDNEIDPEAFSPTADDRAYNFFRALNGYIAPDHTLSKRRISLTNYATKYARSFVEVGQFTLERSATGDAPGSAEPLPKPNTQVTGDDPSFANAFLDPWGNRYIYFYKDTAKQARWKRNGFILLSAGPDGKVNFKDADFRETGDAIDETDAVNRDNIYAAP